MAQSLSVWAHDEAVSALYENWQNSTVFNSQELDKTLLQQFVKDAQILSKQNPNDPQASAISGLIKAFYASQFPGIEGLKLAKQARDELQHALRLDPLVFAELTYAELGHLYHNTPGWPFSFGSQPMAEKLLEKALEVDPQGIMSNLRIGEYWFDHKAYPQAQKYLQTAINIADQNPHISWIDFELLRAKQMLAKIHK
ncbi:hypothetical protein [Flavobacterium sp. W21_SRS_FM6]|uniref:hypothetical protein n=1 Tax=Flavobacterium sp. W21_SRS_FM6 TaxID=3240268 RepID=UPI003F9077FF